VRQAAYQPDRGDLAWINFEPQAGREQAKNRPALILTNREFNLNTGLVIACPITRTDRPFGSRVPPDRHRNSRIRNGGAGQER